MRKVKLLAYALLFCAGAGFVVLGQQHPWHRVYCSAVLPLISWAPSVSGFLSCSNVVQTMKPEYARNVEVAEDADNPGFQVYKPIEEGQPAVFRMTVKRDRQFLFFYPRMQGEACRVEVYEVADERKRKLFSLRGDKTRWTPVGQRHELNMGCVERGLDSGAVDVVLEFVLIGKWAQIWAKGSAVLY